MCFVLFDNIYHNDNIEFPSDFINPFGDNIDLKILKDNGYYNNLFVCNFLLNSDFNTYNKKINNIIPFSSKIITGQLSRDFLSSDKIPPYEMELILDLTEKYKIPFFRLNTKKQFGKNLYLQENILHLYKWMFNKNYQILAKLNDNTINIKYHNRRIFINECSDICCSLENSNDIDEFINYVKYIEKRDINQYIKFEIYRYDYDSKKFVLDLF
jgi:hypothetical protein